MSHRPTFSELRWPMDEESLEEARTWAADAANVVLDWTWLGFDQLRAKHFGNIDFQQPLEQLERDLTSKHFIQIVLLWSHETDGFSSVIPHHEFPELETRPAPPGKPPAYDFAFVHRDNPRIAWPIEAKLVPNPRVLAPYLHDVKKFKSGTAAPFIGEGGMIAYLLSGRPSDFLQKLERKLGSTLDAITHFYVRFHRVSHHLRSSAPRLRLHHMVMECGTSNA